MAQTYSSPIGDYVTSSLVGSITNAATSAVIGAGLNLPATNGILELDYDSLLAIGVDSGPETIVYAGYNSISGVLTGLTRGAASTLAVAHANTATVQSSNSSLYIADLYKGNIALGTSLVGVPAASLRLEDWADFSGSAAPAGVGAMTYVPTINFARYFQIGKSVSFTLSATGTTGGTPNPQISFNLPITCKAAVVNTVFATFVNDGGSNISGYTFIASQTTARITKFDATNFGLGSGRIIQVSGSYEAL